MLRYLEFCSYAIRILSMMSCFLNLTMSCVIHSSEFTSQWRPLAWKVMYHLVVYSASFFFQKIFISLRDLIYLSNVYTQTNIQINMTEPMNTYIWTTHHMLNQLHLKIVSFIQYLLQTGCRKLLLINYCSDMFRPQFLAIFMEVASIFFYLKHAKLKWTTLTKVLITSSVTMCFLLNITLNWCSGMTCMFCE